jgi:hypothetical protein
MHFTTVESCWRLGCSRVFPRELGQAPCGVRPQRLRSRSPCPPGTEGPVRRALRGSARPVRAAGSRLRSRKLATAGCWAHPPLTLWRRGDPSATPSSPLPLPAPHAARVALAPGSGRTRLGCSPAETLLHLLPPLGGPGIPLSHPRATPCSPGSWGLGLHPDPESVCPPPFPAKGPLPALPFLGEDQLQPLSLERKGFPYSGSCRPRPPRTPPPPFHPYPSMGPRLARSALSRVAFPSLAKVVCALLV